MRRLHNLWRLPLSEKRLVLGAVLTSALVRTLLHACNLSGTRRLLYMLVPLSQAGQREHEASRIVWAAEAAGDIIPGSTCLVKALVAQALLRRYGHPATLCIGAGRTDTGGFEAHAWLEDSGSVLIGGPEARVAKFVRFADIDQLIQ